uniref:Ig-like domain-containing protein n=1 Tax=Maylandia zebra TaxID=106582 RepID=A0A3P9DJC0_9CICH
LKTITLPQNPPFILRLRTTRPSQKNITAESGQDITLTCRAPNNNITVLDWSKPDLKDSSVLFYDKKFNTTKQHPSFKNRVALQDRQMKDGDVSLILKNVTVNDTGTYECGVIQKRTDGLKLLCSITLSVVDPPGDYLIFSISLVTLEMSQHVRPKYWNLRRYSLLSRVCSFNRNVTYTSFV